jgi:TolB-like protein
MIIELSHEADFPLGPLTVRPSSREVVAGGRSQVLEPRIMQVLVALARRRGEVVSRDDLIAACWAGRTVGEDAINRCIAGVRRLAEAYGAFTLETIPRVGYRLGAAAAPATPQAGAASQANDPPRVSICVLPFANMSDDPQQEYFSDGISEDIITDLSKVSALLVVARNTAFTFKGQAVDAMEVAQRLNVSHILEGSVRKAGGRVRITAQLIDGATGGHSWAERWDRDLTDIFALQDEISQAVVEALRLRLLPEEKTAIERRGTDSVEAYNLYLMARQLYLRGRLETRHGQDVMIRLCASATRADPNYAPAWALLALVQTIQASARGLPLDAATAATERALALDGTLAEAHVAKARILRFRWRARGIRHRARPQPRLARGELQRRPAAHGRAGLRRRGPVPGAGDRPLRDQPRTGHQPDGRAPGHGRSCRGAGLRGTAARPQPGASRPGAGFGDGDGADGLGPGDPRPARAGP